MCEIHENPETSKLLEALINEVINLRKDIDDLSTGLRKSKIEVKPTSVYNNKEIREILGVDERLIKKYRDNGYLAFHRQDDKYWYLGKDIEEFLKRTRYEAFA